MYFQKNLYSLATTKFSKWAKLVVGTLPDISQKVAGISRVIVAFNMIAQKKTESYRPQQKFDMASAFNPKNMYIYVLSKLVY